MGRGAVLQTVLIKQSFLVQFQVVLLRLPTATLKTHFIYVKKMKPDFCPVPVYRRIKGGKVIPARLRALRLRRIPKQDST